MIEPTKADLGRTVRYIGNRFPGGQPELGILTSINPGFCFVRYGASATSQATRRADLEWADA
jgi:hypothetical protein